MGQSGNLFQKLNLNSFYILFQPLWHVRIIDFPSYFDVLIFVPVIFITIKELLPVALVLNNFVSFKSILVPIIILLTMTLPFVSGINYYINRPFVIYNFIFIGQLKNKLPRKILLIFVNSYI